MDLAKTLILVHATFGGIGLLSGIVSMIVKYDRKKGSKIHKKVGKIFVYGMLLISVLSIPVCFMTGHENMLLFAVAIFTIYLVATG